MKTDNSGLYLLIAILVAILTGACLAIAIEHFMGLENCKQEAFYATHTRKNLYIDA